MTSTLYRSVFFLVFSCPLLVFPHATMAATYDYDGLNRLNTTTYGDGETVNYAYDKVGNRQTRTETAALDSDDDGLSDATELAGGTDPGNADTDSDGIADGIEDLNHNGLLDAGETDPLNSDTDLDGIADGNEDANHNGWLDPGESDPRSGDTDGDGITDSNDICPSRKPVRLVSDSQVFYSSIQNAYENFALSDDVIEVHAGPLSEDLNFLAEKSISLKGGFDCEYSVNSDSAVIHGSMTVSNGTVTVEGITLQ